MHANFALTPEYGLLLARMIGMGGKYRKAADEAAREIAETAVARVRTGILEQVFPVAPLTPEWSARKARQALDPRIFIATKRYLRSLGVERAGVAAYGVTADMEALYRLEMGTRNQEARPHWAPVIEAVREEAPDIVHRRIFLAVFGG